MTFAFEFLTLLRALVVDLGPPVRSYILSGRVDGLRILFSFYMKDKRGITASGNIVRIPSQVPLAEAILSLACCCQPPSLGDSPVFEGADEEEICGVIGVEVERALLHGINETHSGQILDDMLFFERGSRISTSVAEAETLRREALLLRFFSHFSFCPNIMYVCYISPFKKQIRIHISLNKLT